MANAAFVPLRELLVTSDEAGIAPADGDGFLDRVGIDDLSFTEGATSLTATLTLAFRDEIGFTVPGCSAVGLFLGKTGNPTTLTVQAIITDQSVTIKLVNVALTLRMPPAVLKPVTLTPDGFKVKTLADGSTAPYEISLSGIDIAYTPGGDFSIGAPGGPAITLAPAMVGDSGVIIESDDIRLHFDRTAPPPPGQSPGFQGIHIAQAVVHLPKQLSISGAKVYFLDASIGSGGFSGTIGLDDTALTWDTAQNKYNGLLVGSLAGFAAGIRAVEFSFLQNVMQKGSLQVEAYLPYLEKRLGLELRIAATGDFLLALTGPQAANADPDVKLDKGLIRLKQPGVIEATLESIAVARKGDDVAFSVTGSIRPLFGGIDWPEVGVKALTIHSDGRVTIGGGWIDLPAQKGAGLFGFPLEIRQVGFGTEDGRPWVGFSGGIKLVEGLPIGGAVEGLKIKWDPANPASFNIDLKGISIDLEIPEVITLSGHVAMFRENGKEWFQGGAKVTLHPLTCTLDAQILVGRTPNYSFFYIFLEVGLPVGIPLGCTSLALYGMGGLFGYNVRPDRRDGEPWYTGWYKRSPEGPTNSKKWTDQQHNLAFGATVTIGTLADNGMAVNARVLLILLIPGPVIMIDGRANLMRDRKSLLTGDPLFKTLAVIDGQSGTLLVNIEPHFLYPEGEDGGSVIDLTGVAEGFFDFNHPERWYVNVGVRDPKEKRIRATLIKLFKATSYLMLNNDRVALGASVSIDIKYEYGPVGVRLGVWFDADAELVFRPLQLTAAVGLHGRAELKAVGLSLGIELDATARVQTPHPYTFAALLHAKADLPWPLPDVEVNIPFEYEEPKPSPVTIPLQGINLVTLKGSEYWDTGVAADPKLVPLDGRAVMVFAKGMHDDAFVGGNIQAASSETSGDLTFDYRLTSLRLERLVAGAWVVQAARPQAGAPRALTGMWLPMTNDATPCAKLMLDVKNPFDAFNHGSAAYAEEFVARNSGYPGVYVVSDYESLAVGTVFNGTATVPYLHDGLAYDVGGLRNFNGGVRVLDATTATPIAGKVARWPQRHALYLPQLWGAVADQDDPDAAAGSGTPVPPKRLRITLPPASIGQVRLDLIALEPVMVVAFNAAGIELDRVAIAQGNLAFFTPPRREQVTLTAAGIRSVEVDGSNTYVFAVHYLSLDVTTTPGKINTHNKTEAQHWADEEILLEPDSTYRLVVETAVDTSRKSANAQWPTEVDAGEIGPATLPSPTMQQGRARYAFAYESYFRTEGPPGFLGPEIDRIVAASAPALPPESGTAKAAGSLVRSLRSYVRRTTPGDGERPVYRTYDLVVHFNESYVKRMYASHGNRSLRLALSDRNGDPPRLRSGGTAAAPLWTATQFTSTWDKQRKWLPARGAEQWVNTVADAEWLALPAAGAPHDDTLCVQISGPPLAADSGYVAALQADPATDAIDAELHRFAFTTSRFASFVHHIHGFDGHVWDSDQGRDTPLAALTGAQQSTLENAAKSGKPEDFGTLRDLFQIAARPLPETLEVTLLHDAARRWGFLLETAEPLDAARTRVRSCFRPLPLAPPAHSGPLRIRDARIGQRSGADYNSEWIDLVIIEPAALNGWRIEHLQAPGSAAFVPLLTFAQTAMLYPGQIVRLHAGAAPATLPDDGFQHVYAASSAATAQWLLNAGGDTLRLVEPAGPARSVFGMLPEWVNVDCYWVWNADHTRAFVLPFHRVQGCLLAMVTALPAWLQQLLGAVTATPIPGLAVGGYRFEFRYLLDASAEDSSLPILSIGGRANPEEAVLQVAVSSSP